MKFGVLNNRILSIFLAQLLLVALSNYLSFMLRFDGNIPLEEKDLFVHLLPLLILIRGVTFTTFRLHEGLWRYIGFWDVRKIIGAIFISSGVFFILVHLFFRLTIYPRSIFIIDALILFILLTGLRATPRLIREWWHVRGTKPILICGAGDIGERLARDIISDDNHEYVAIGFVDEDDSKIGQYIHGIPILGTLKNLPKIVNEKHPSEIFLALNIHDPKGIRRVVKVLEPFKLPIKVVPSFQDLMKGRVAVNRMRRLSVEDLLDRIPVGLDFGPARRLIEGKHVLVTGAAGTVGSEICRQVLSFNPSRLILFDWSENGLYKIHKSLGEISNSDRLRVVVGDIKDVTRLQSTTQEHMPHIIFHAAAHKHVPLMEENLYEAVKNNVLGTKSVVDAADQCHAEKFVLISTDKAVNPVSVMGVTKRIAELLVLSKSSQSRTQFVTVRFGNVLSSNGSVIPLFLEQINAARPVTVTHPEVRRYFMLTQEAVGLVLLSAGIGEQGAIYILEMGEQIKILDLARNLIRLSGFVPDDDIPIRFIGLRPGEKLVEELVGPDEQAEATSVKSILKVKPIGDLSVMLLENELAVIQQIVCSSEGRKDLLLDHLSKLVPSYCPDGAKVH